MAVDHLSLYQLTIEDGTVFGARHAAGKLRDLPDDEVAADMYLETQDFLTDLGMPAYELSNHAAPGSESRHNLVYWRQGDWAGIGPGAHGRLGVSAGRLATVAERTPGGWLNLVENEGSGDIESAIQPTDDIATEYLLMAMRLSEGMDLTRYAAKGGKLDRPRLNRLLDDGLVEIREDRILPTKRGRPVLNYILREMAG